MANRTEWEIDVNAKAAIDSLAKLKRGVDDVANAAKQQLGPSMARAGRDVEAFHQQVTTAARDAARATETMSRMGSRSGASMNLMSDAAKKSGREVGMLVNSVAEMGYTAFSTIPATRQFGMALAMAGGSAVTMGAALGPIGIAIAVLGNLVPTLAQSFSDTAESADDTATAIDETTRSLDDFISSARSAIVEAGRARRIAAGFATEEEIGGQIQQQEERAGQLLGTLTRLRTRLSEAQQISVLRTLNEAETYGRTAEQVQHTLRTTLGGEDAQRISQIASTIAELSRARRESNRLRAQQAEVQAENIAADIEEAEVEAEIERERNRRKPRNSDEDERRMRAMNAVLDEFFSTNERLLSVEADRLDLLETRIALSYEERDVLRDILRDTEQASKLSIDDLMRQEAGLEFTKEEAIADAQTNEAKAAAAKEAKEQQEQYNKTVSRSRAGMEGVLDIAKRTAAIQRETNASFGEAFKTAVDEWLKGFALQEAYKGVAATAEAIGSAVTNQPNAAAKFAEAGIHFALAAAAGGASAAIPNGGGGGGGGGGGRRQGPEAVGGGASGGGGGTVVVNFNAPVSEAEIGRQQERAARAARRRFGS